MKRVRRRAHPGACRQPDIVCYNAACILDRKDKEKRMFRKLKAIEIAEGALLADIVVIFQLLIIYLPVGGGFFRTLNFIVFAILVLRRGLYVGSMGLCVAMFLIGVVAGPQYTILLLLEGLGGLFLGVTMRHRWRHIPLLFVGITAGALTLFVLLWLLSLVSSLPMNDFVVQLRQVYQAVMPVIGQVAAKIGLGVWWRQSLYPAVAWVAALLFTYWVAALYLAIWLILCPFVTLVYTVTNFFVRVFGYDVRPFPDGKINWLLWRIQRRVVRIAVRRRMLRKSGARA